MTYSKDDESAIDLPSWMKWMRGLVMALLVASIVAMLCVAWAAVRLVSQVEPKDLNWQQEVSLPNDATPISMTQLANGQLAVIYEEENSYAARIFDEDGEVLSEVSFK